MQDNFGRQINYLRLSVTDLCNLRCKYCMPDGVACKLNHEDILRLEEIEKIADIFISLGITKIRITGGEPLLRKNIMSLINNLGRREGLKELALTTNGILLKDFAKDLKQAGVNSINISLDTLNKQKFYDLTGKDDLHKVLEGLEETKKIGFKSIKLNVVLIKNFNDDEIEDFIDLTMHENIDVRFIELMPVGSCASWALGKYILNNIVLEKMPELKKEYHQELSSPALYYKLPQAKGRVGLINSVTGKFCAWCNRIRLSADGHLKLCLHKNNEIDLKKYIREKKDIDKIVREFVLEKPESHKLENGVYSDKDMFRIGG